MRKLYIFVILLALVIIPVSAEELTPPPAPDEAQLYMPQEPQSFSGGLIHIIKVALGNLQPEIAQAASLCAGVVGAALICIIAQQFTEQAKHTADIVAAILIAVLLLSPTNALIGLGRRTVQELSEYGKLLVPVLTAGLAAQGAVGTSTALYAATTAFSAILNSVIFNLIIPVVYVFLCLSIAGSVMEEDALKRLKDFSKDTVIWGLKTVLYVYTAYMTITGVISGSADATAIKATKMAISTAVPFVGGVLSEASETILVSAGVMKSAVGVYGLLVVVSLLIGPFLKIGIQYLLLKLTSVVAGVFASKQASDLLADFTSAMGMVLSMIGVQSLLIVISTVCFMRGVS